ncbi:MAG: hypothetical protein J1F67_04160 [Muribaculaceae bacterium]|nr:hypothetical protein [Muribaculaceae bacterium]
MQSYLQNLLDKTYELEGLIHLAIKRDEDRKDFLRLISKKGNEIAELINSFELINDEPSEVVPTSITNFILEEYALDEDTIAPESSLDKAEKKDIVTAETTEKKIDRINEPQKGKLVFSINERFRFRKELFDNSDADFNTSLALVASMDNFEEAEDYFINEEGFDTNNPVVKEFMNIIKKYFK